MCLCLWSSATEVQKNITINYKRRRHVNGFQWKQHLKKPIMRLRTKLDTVMFIVRIPFCLFPQDEFFIGLPFPVKSLPNLLQSDLVERRKKNVPDWDVSIRGIDTRIFAMRGWPDLRNFRHWVLNTTKATRLAVFKREFWVLKVSWR